MLLLRGFFGRGVSWCRVDLVESRLGRPGRIESVRHVCGVICDVSGIGKVRRGIVAESWIFN